MAPGVGGQPGQPAPSPAHTTSSSGAGHRGVQRSISATSGNKPRRGSTGAATSDNVQTCELTGGSGEQSGAKEGEGRSKVLGPLSSVALSIVFTWFDLPLMNVKFHSRIANLFSLLNLKYFNLFCSVKRLVCTPETIETCLLIPTYFSLILNLKLLSLLKSSSVDC